MRIFCFLSLTLILFSCQTEKSKKSSSILSYILVPGIKDHSIREFRHRTDTSLAVLLLRENHTFINDSVVEFEFMWSTNEDVPVSQTTERWGKDYMEILKGSFYEIDSMKRYHEAPLKFSGNRKISTDNRANKIAFSHTYNSQPPLTIRTGQEWKFSYQSVDSLGPVGKDCVVVTLEEHADAYKADSLIRKNIEVRGVRIYARDKGLIRFGNQRNGKLKWFIIRES